MNIWSLLLTVSYIISKSWKIRIWLVRLGIFLIIADSPSRKKILSILCFLPFRTQFTNTSTARNGKDLEKLQYADHLPTWTQKLPIDETGNRKRTRMCIKQRKASREQACFCFFFWKRKSKNLIHKTIMFTMATFTAVKPLGKLISFFRAD